MREKTGKGSIMPRYSLQIWMAGGGLKPAKSMTWHIQEYGEPTNTNLNKVVEMFEQSLRPGGVNAHLSIHSVVSASVLDQDKGIMVAGWNRKTARPNEPMPADIKADREADKPRHEAYSAGDRLGFANGAAWAVQQITSCRIETCRKISTIALRVRQITEAICDTPEVTSDDEKKGIRAMDEAEAKGGEELRELLKELGSWQKTR